MKTSAWAMPFVVVAMCPAIVAAQLSEIGIGDFSGLEVIETFDGSLGQGFGSSEAFGQVTVTSNNSSIIRQDFGNFDPHGGSGDPALFDLITSGSDLTLEWASPMTRVGFLLAGGNSSTNWTVSVYDGSGAILGTKVVSFPVVVGYPNDPPIFVGFAAPGGIGRIEIDENVNNGQYTGIDDIRYEREGDLFEIGIGDFSGYEVIETFDGTLGQGFGSSEVFGEVTVTSNNSTISRGDFGNFDPHGGSGDPALFDAITSGSDLTFEWASPMTRVGFLLAGGNSSTNWTVSVYDGSGAIFGTKVFSFPVVAGFPNDPPVFVGFSAPGGIGRIEIDENVDNGQYTGIDDIRYEAVVFEDGFEGGSTAAWDTTGH